MHCSQRWSRTFKIIDLGAATKASTIFLRSFSWTQVNCSSSLKSVQKLLILSQICSKEEKEKRLEDVFEFDLDCGNHCTPKEDLPDERHVFVAGKMTKETLSTTDSILEELYMIEVELSWSTVVVPEQQPVD